MTADLGMALGEAVMRPLKQRGSKLAYVQKREDAKREEQERQRHQDGVLIAGALNRVADQLVTDEREDEGRDSRKAFREYLTIALVFGTVVAAGIGDVFFYGQMSEMQKAYGPIADQANAAKRAADAATKQSEIATRQAENSDKALFQSQRAWVGPSNASFSAEPKTEEPIEVAIQYQNSGREPALNFSYNIDMFGVIENNPDFGNRVTPFMTKCLATSAVAPGQVVYPSTGFSQYTLGAKSDKTLVDDLIVSGEKVIVIQGCFLYATGQTVHHSFFCFFFKNKLTRIANLNICQSGHYAD
jgi:hypothetical protein